MATKRLYRSNYGEIFGVCKGFAQWRDLPVGGVRLAVILIAFFTAVFPCLIIYVILGIFLPANPNENASSSGDNGDCNNYQRGSSQRSSHYYSDHQKSSQKRDYAGMDEYEEVHDEEDDDEALRKRYEELKKKVEKMEESVLDKENDWDQRFRDEEK